MNIEIKNNFIILFKNNKLYKNSKTFKKQLLDLFLKNTRCILYTKKEKEYIENILKTHWELGLNKIKLVYNSHVKYKINFEYIEETILDCERKINYKKIFTKHYYYEMESIKYNNINLLLNNLKKKCILIGKNKNYNCNKYFSNEELKFLLLSPLILDEFIEDDILDNVNLS